MAAFAAVGVLTVSLLAGSASSHRLVDVVTASFAPALNGLGWGTATEQVTLTRSGPGTIDYSAAGAETIAATTGTSPVTFALSAEGTTTITVTGPSPAVFTVKIDKTPPSIFVQRTTANSFGWNNTDVTLAWGCNDTGSGIASCTPKVTVTTEGADQKVTGTAYDVAGNFNPRTSNVSIDKTAPTILGVASPTPNTNGWNSTLVTVTFRCADALSGIASCTAPVTLSGEGAGQSAAGSAADKAGNTSSTTVRNISIDRTPPLVAFARHAGWITVDGSVTLDAAATDALSGVESTAFAHRTVRAWMLQPGLNSFDSSATDKAGNSTTAKTGLTVRVTIASLEKLTRMLVSNKPVADALVALLAKHRFASYVSAVNAQKGKSLGADQAAALVRFANALK
jgi:hypothetical protein